MGPMDCAIKGMEHAAAFYAKDLEALTEEQILGVAGGTARKPVDFTYEVALVNRRVAARLNGVEPQPMPTGGEWIVAPPELQSKAAISDFMSDACSELIETARSLPAEDFAKLVGPQGHEEPAYSLVNFAAMHTMYHDAQLNFIQCLCGDCKMHWV